MREIKFRAWDEKRKTMFQVYTGCLPKGVTRKRDFFIGFNSTGLEVSEYEGKGYWRIFPVMQYTGFKDDCDEELYEGDIVLALFTGETYEIIWDTIGSGFLFSNTDKEKAKRGAIDYYEFEEECGSFGFRRIGNIYEHPHLLERSDSTESAQPKAEADND